MNQPPTKSFSLPLSMWLGYVAFVIYGSLVPLKYKVRTFDDALVAFQNIPYLQLGIASRADWIANGVLYVPVAFLTANILAQILPRLPRTISFILVSAFSASLAVAVEFTQIYFPQRTVSLNDIMAEWIGCLIGFVLFTMYGSRFQNLISSFLNDQILFRRRLLETYVLIYLAFSLFPYDVLISWIEIENKFHSNAWGLFLAGNSSKLFLLSLQSLVEILLAIPLGYLLGKTSSNKVIPLRRSVILGLLFGASLEIAQFFLASGISQGWSVLTRAGGVYVGLHLSRILISQHHELVTNILRRFSFPIGAIYLATLLEINGSFSARWQGVQAAVGQFSQVNFMPFYYHYYTSEGRALSSHTIVCLSYIPVGILSWVNRRSLGFALLLTLILAVGVEASKIFLPHTHPDTTNILLGCLTVWLSMKLLTQLMGSKVESVDSKAKAVNQEIAGQSVHKFPGWLIFCFIITLAWVATFPALQIFMCLTLVSCAAAVWHRPAWIFAIIPATLPVFDLAPWSGRFYLDEFDAILLVGLAVAYARTPVLLGTRFPKDAVLTVAIALMGISFAVSTVLGLLPLQLPNANSFNSYYSPYNALRITKGAVWAFFIYRYWRRISATGVDVRNEFGWGMSIGLALTVATIFWERVAFTGLWNFESTYRVTGPFSAIHIGGAYIECFLAAATPFLIALMVTTRHWFVKVAGLALLLATTYALMVTFSRNGFSAFAVAIFFVVVAALLKSTRWIRSAAIFAGIVIAVLAVAVPIYKGDFAQARMATVKADLGVRQAHWDDALSIRDADFLTSFLGMGIGRFPETSYWRSTLNPRSGTYRLEKEGSNTFLRLGSGDSIYVDQLVSIDPKKSYTLKFDVRTTKPDATITIPICEKWILTSYNCIWQSAQTGSPVNVWSSKEIKFNAEQLSVSPWYSQRPVKLSLYYGGATSTIDVDNIRLENDLGQELLRNGEFSSGMDHWFFITDSHLQWHTKSLLFGLLFDQGWLGLVTVIAFCILAIGRATKNTFRGSLHAGAALASLASFLTVGIFDTLIDSPRFLTLFLLLCLYCTFGNDYPKRARSQADSAVKPKLRYG